MFFHNFSTFLGKANLYLEDLYVKPQRRGLGFGKSLFSALARIAVEQDFRRLYWWCLHWNEPSIKFYNKMARFQWMNGQYIESKIKLLKNYQKN